MSGQAVLQWEARTCDIPSEPANLLGAQHCIPTRLSQLPHESAESKVRVPARGILEEAASCPGCLGASSVVTVWGRPMCSLLKA